MEKQTRKEKKMKWKQYIPLACFVLLGAVCGFLMAGYLDKGIQEEGPAGKELLSLFGLFVLMYVSILVQMIIHEAGHLVFGLLSGYQFSSFRIMSFMWVKENQKIRLRRLSIAGTGGQCLMSPPDMKDGRIPVMLYNFGGSLMNAAAGMIGLLLYLIFSGTYFGTVMLMFAIIGFAFAMINGIPMHAGAIDNDGYNALSLSRNPEALRSFWIQMKVNEQTAKGIRIKDMPEEWFEVPSDAAMKNSMVAALGVFCCNRLVDAKRFKEADDLMAHLMEIESGMVGLHRSLMVCDRIYIELITENRREIIDGMYTKEQKKFMKTMKNFPSVIRTEYVYALLYERDLKKAEKCRAQYEKCAKSYPYPNDVQAERELMELAAEKAGQ